MKRLFPIGTMVRISEGAGLSSGKVGLVVQPDLDHRGFPKHVEGVYKPFDGRKERYIRMADGSFITMFNNYLSPAKCGWFLKCVRPAVTTEPHPILGNVPICKECQEWCRKMEKK